MNRIKFRSWQENAKEGLKAWSWEEMKDTSLNDFFSNSNNNFVIMQYIGEKDRVNQKEIYEGDVVKALHRNYDNEDDKEKYFETFKVTYLNGCFMFGNWNAHEFLNRFIYTEVIGNKFENGELWEVAN